MPSCFVPKCKNNDRWKEADLSFHAFPKKLQKLWLEAICRPINTNLNQQRICSVHFETGDFEYIGRLKKLKFGTIPSKNLPNKDLNLPTSSPEESPFSLEPSLSTGVLPLTSKDLPPLTPVSTIPAEGSLKRKLEQETTKPQRKLLVGTSCLGSSGQFSLKLLTSSSRTSSSNASKSSASLKTKAKMVKFFHSYRIMPPKFNYSKEQMDSALEAISRGMPVATAAKSFRVPRTTLLDKKSGRTPKVRKMGPPSILTSAEEEILVNWILLLSQKHRPVTKQEVLDSVQMIIKATKRKSPFTDGRPGKKWFAAFLKRNPQITTRIAQNLTPARESVTEEQLRRWFREIREYLHSENLMEITENPSRVFNADESAFFLQPKGDKVLARKGEKSVYIAGTNDDKENRTVLLTANGQGDFAPPMIIFKYERIPSSISAAMNKEWGIGRSETGWMCGATFYEYITNVFVPWLDKNNIQRPIILFIDGHISHLTYNLSQYCKQNQIEIIALYPNSTHLIQPMDVAVFKPLKAYWKKSVRQFHVDNDGSKLRKEHFPKLFESALSLVSKETVQNGFKACGLSPFSVENVKFSKISSNKNAGKIDKIKQKQQLHVLEELIPDDRLILFKQVEEKNEWNGRIDDQSLFEIWRKLKNDIGAEAEEKSKQEPRQEPYDNGKEKTTNNKLVIHSIQIFTPESKYQHPHTSQTSPTTIENITKIHAIEKKNHETPQKENPGCSYASQSGSSYFPDNIKSSNLSANELQLAEKQHISSTSLNSPVSEFHKNVPTPFKKALFWPSTLESGKKKRSKEKIPSAITSKAWQEYHEKKEAEKSRKLEEKENRAKTREAKRNQKSELVKKRAEKRRKISYETSDEDEDWIESGDSLDDVSEIQTVQDEDLHLDEDLDRDSLPLTNYVYNIGDFLLVKFLSGSRKNTQYRYACVVQRKFKNGEIEIMSLKCTNDDKTVYRMVDSDISVIKVEEILQKLPQPLIQTVGDRLKYVFPKSLNILEY